MSFRLGVSPGAEIFLRINFAHLRQQAQSGGWINFCVFDARSSSGSRDDNSRLLAQLTAKARASRLRVDQSALAFNSNGRLQLFGSPPLVKFLSASGRPVWTHHMDV